MPAEVTQCLRGFLAVGARLVAAPRHADVALVTGPVTRNMAEPLRRTVAAMGWPRLVVVAVGDCAVDCGRSAAGTASRARSPVSYRWIWPCLPAGLGLPHRVRVPVVGVLTSGVGKWVVRRAWLHRAEAGGRPSTPSCCHWPGRMWRWMRRRGLFMAVAGAVVAAGAVYGVGYAAGHGAHGIGSRSAQMVLPSFALSLVLVPVAASVSTFLMLWELMAPGSVLLRP